MTFNNKKVEILAPAGSFESFMAAISAGADAVYAGGPMFGARAFATNFTEEKLLEAIDIAHLYGRRFYLTVNTLVKDCEIPKLYKYLTPLYEHGLDAVIVQDVGVMNIIRREFPGLGIHASTQTTVTNKEGALFLKEQGAERVVPARELSLKEVNDIYNETGMEVECFVHGALCYCYSGQCLMSSLIGGRSGNRGQCAQPCRLMYNVNGNKKYFMSLKDICTLDIIPDLIDAGIYSFKIEGRMKKPEYVASVTAMYRKYADLYLKSGRKGYKVLKEDKEKLMDIYNRGNFSEGYYNKRNGKDMVSLSRPNHTGVEALKVINQQGNKVTVKALTSINKGDVIELSSKGDSRLNNYTIGQECNKGDKLILNVARGAVFKKDTILNRIRNEKLLTYIGDTYINAPVKQKAKAKIILRPGYPIELNLISEDIDVTVYSDAEVQEALNKPLDKDRITKQLNKTGNSKFEFTSIDTVVFGDIFVPMAAINELRRKGLEKLEEVICLQYRRLPLVNKEVSFDGYDDLEESTSYITFNQDDIVFTAVCESLEQLKAVGNDGRVKRVYVNSTVERDFFKCDELFSLVRNLKNKGMEVYLGMPYIFRDDAIEIFYDNLKMLYNFDGFLVRNFESYRFLRQNGFDNIILDRNMYVFNKEAKDFWNKEGVYNYTVPAELNLREIKELKAFDMEFNIYGRTPVMISAQCIKKTSKGCDKTPVMLNMSDRTGESYSVKNCCGFCYNVVYDTKPVYLCDMADELLEVSPAAYRMDFSTEGYKETLRILNNCIETVTSRSTDEFDGDYTRGHFTRGVN